MDPDLLQVEVKLFDCDPVNEIEYFNVFDKLRVQLTDSVCDDVDVNDCDQVCENEFVMDEADVVRDKLSLGEKESLFDIDDVMVDVGVDVIDKDDECVSEFVSEPVK
jgi:hypothetical protein